MKKKIAIIGSGFSSLAAAACLAKEGHEVHVFEKNNGLGGRASQTIVDGFIFDMGPSWYWMPEVFENFFLHFGKKTSDFYDLVRLDPSYTVVFSKGDIVELPANYEELKALFEQLEAGAGANLDLFLAEAEYKYKVGMQEFVWKPGTSIMEFADLRVVTSLFKLDMLTSVSSQVCKLFKNEKIRKILEFPVLFLGATPEKTPALYSLMNYADIKLGTWYPIGGMHKIVEGMVSVGRDLGVNYHTNHAVDAINVNGGIAQSIKIGDDKVTFDYLVAGADYEHVEQNLLPVAARMYDFKYWDSRTMAPSSLLFYLGLKKKMTGVHHHTLFFDADFKKHALEIYESPQWPTDPLFYMCVPSITDESVAPEGCENVFLLLPLAPNLKDDHELREKYFDLMCDRVFDVFGYDIKDNILFKRSFCVDDFTSEYNAYKGNAYGLANTLKQTAFLKPKLRSDKVSNLFFTGQLTSPGPGMPPSIISGQVVSKMICENIKKSF